jgi:hypothetical protein
MVQRNVLLPSSGLKSNPSKKPPRSRLHITRGMAMKSRMRWAGLVALMEGESKRIAIFGSNN